MINLMTEIMYQVIFVTELIFSVPVNFASFCPYDRNFTSLPVSLFAKIDRIDPSFLSYEYRTFPAETLVLIHCILSHCH